VKNPARGGGRWVEVAPDRLATWVDSFAAGHQGLQVTITSDGADFTAGDGAVAECHVPFPPFEPPPPVAGTAAGGLMGGTAGGGTAAGGAMGGTAGGRTLDGTAGGGTMGGDPGEVARVLAGHATAARTVGVLLVRLGGYAAGVFIGSPPRLAASKVGSRLVHGRSAAGGQSQQRFARRREKQAAEALGAAASTAAALLGPYRDRLQAVVLGGDRRAVDGLRGDPRLAPYFALATDRFLTVPDPRLAVLRDTPKLFLAIRIRLTEPPPQE
jgi:Actinobacteria/chloroflexi VLRF1 release factor